MSGSSNQGYGGSGTRTTDCNIVEKTLLNSPKAAALPQLKAGVELDVVATNSGRSLDAHLPGGNVAGSLTPNALPELLDCITNRGRKYKATVIKVTGAAVEVEIRPR